LDVFGTGDYSVADKVEDDGDEESPRSGENVGAVNQVSRCLRVSERCERPILAMKGGAIELMH
jgi:hypothetical protein